MKRLVAFSVVLLIALGCSSANPPKNDGTPAAAPHRAGSLPDSIVFDSETYYRVSGPQEPKDATRYLRNGESAKSFSTWSKILIIRRLPGEHDASQAAQNRLIELKARADVQGGIYESSPERALMDYAYAMKLPNFLSFEVHHLKFFATEDAVTVYEFIVQKGDRNEKVIDDFIAKELENTRPRFREEMRNAEWLR